MTMRRHHCLRLCATVLHVSTGGGSADIDGCLCGLAPGPGQEA